MPESLNDALVARAKRDDKPVSRVVQRALEKYLNTRSDAKRTNKLMT